MEDRGTEYDLVNFLGLDQENSEKKLIMLSRDCSCDTLVKEAAAL